MFSFFKKKKTVAHIKLNGVIGNAGKFKQGIDFAGQEALIKKAFSLKKAVCIAVTINSPGGSPVQSHLIYSLIRQEAKKSKKKVFHSYINFFIWLSGFNISPFSSKLSLIDFAVAKELSLSPCMQTESISQGICLPLRQFID